MTDKILLVFSYLAEGLFSFIMALFFVGLYPYLVQRAGKYEEKDLSILSFAIAAAFWGIKGITYGIIYLNNEEAIIENIATAEKFLLYGVFIFTSVFNNLFLLQGVARSEYAPTKLGLKYIIPFFNLIGIGVVLVILEALAGWIAFLYSGDIRNGTYLDISITTFTVVILGIVLFRSFEGRRLFILKAFSSISLALIVLFQIFFLPVTEEILEVSYSGTGFVIAVSMLVKGMVGFSLFVLYISYQKLISTDYSNSRISLFYRKKRKNRPYEVRLFLPQEWEEEKIAFLSNRQFVALLALATQKKYPNTLNESVGDGEKIFLLDNGFPPEQDPLGYHANLNRLRQDLGIKNRGVLIRNFKNRKQYVLTVEGENIELDDSLWQEEDLHPFLPQRIKSSTP